MSANSAGGDRFGDRFGLPAVMGVEISRVRFNPPMRFYSEGHPVEKHEAVQLMVRTTGPLPVRDLTPVLYVGEIKVDDYEQVGGNLYRFYAYDIEDLVPGAPIALGWPFAPEAKLPTNFRFNLKPPLIT